MGTGSWEQAASRWAIGFLDDVDQLGPIKIALVRTAGGEQAVLIAYLNAPPPFRDHLSIEMRFPHEDRVCAELDELLGELAVEPSEVVSVHPDVAFTRWAVMRQDDNGARYLVEECDAKHLAMHRARQLEAVPHKQHYWIERRAEPSNGLRPCRRAR